MNGIIFFEDGSTAMFGQLSTVSHIIPTVNRVLRELQAQERQSILDSITKNEIKVIIERLQQEQNGDNSNI